MSTDPQAAPSPYGSFARAYLAQGHWPLPLPERQKAMPPTGYTGHDGRDPDADDINAWVRDRSTGNIAIRLGHGLVGIDIDAYDGKPGLSTLADLEALHGPLPATIIVTSRDDGSGIRLYRLPDGASSDGSRTGWPGIEILRHSHRYVVAPPSIHPKTGATYRCFDERTGEQHDVIPGIWAWPELPPLWVAALRPDIKAAPAPSEYRGNWGTDSTVDPYTLCKAMRARLDDSLARLRTGQARHDVATAEAFALLRLADMGHSGGQTALLMLGDAFRPAIAADRAGGGPEADREWRSIVETAQSKVDADPTPQERRGCCGAQSTMASDYADLSSLIAAMPRIVEELPSTNTPEAEHAALRERTSWWPKDLASVLSGDDPEPPPTMLQRTDGASLIYPCKVNGLIGESESGKTWVALLCVLQVLKRGRRVLYLDFEDSAAGIVSRLRLMGATDEDLSRFAYIGPDESLGLLARQDLAEALAELAPDLIVLDGYNAAMTLLGLDLMSNTDATKFAQQLLKPLAATGAAVLYIDHQPKAKEQRGKGGIGAQAKRAMTTGSAITVEVAKPFGRGQTGSLRLTVDKDRPGHVRAVASGGAYVGTAHLVSDPATGDVEVSIAPPTVNGPAAKPSWRPTGYMERISAFLASVPDGASGKAIEESVTGKREHIRAALDVLVDEGYVARQTGARGAILHLRLRPYYEIDDLSDEPDDDF